MKDCVSVCLSVCLFVHPKRPFPCAQHIAYLAHLAREGPEKSQRAITDSRPAARPVVVVIVVIVTGIVIVGRLVAAGLLGWTSQATNQVTVCEFGSRGQLSGRKDEKWLLESQQSGAGAPLQLQMPPLLLLSSRLVSLTAGLAGFSLAGQLKLSCVPAGKSPAKAAKTAEPTALPECVCVCGRPAPTGGGGAIAWAPIARAPPELLWPRPPRWRASQHKYNGQTSQAIIIELIVFARLFNFAKEPPGRKKYKLLKPPQRHWLVWQANELL